MRQFPLEQRKDLLLRFYPGISFQDMSVILGVSKSAPKMRVKGVLEALLERFSAGPGQPTREALKTD